jgi:hypothetical protein
MIGVIIVAVAVVIGINLFNSREVSANRDAVISDLNNFTSLAHAYYRKPARYGGGNNSFIGWQIPKELVTTVNGNYTAKIGNQSVVLIGIGNCIGNDGTNPVKVTSVVGPEIIVSTTVNN